MAANAAEYNTPLDDETAASWRTTWPLLHCPSCAATQSNHKSDVLMQDTNQSSAGCGPLSCYPWLRNLQCSKCYGKWSICIDCASVRKPFVTRHQVRRHNARKHFLIPSTTDKPPSKSNKRPRDEESLTTTIDAPAFENRENAAGGDTTDFILMDENGGYDDEASDHDNLALEEAGGVVHEAGLEAVTFPFEGDRNTKYFTNEHRGLGVAYLVSQSQFGMDFLMDKLLQEDLSFQLHLASLISGMSRGQQKKFAVVMRKYHLVSAMKSEEAARKKLLASSAGSNPISGVDASPHIDPGGPSMGSPATRWFTRMPDSFQDMRHLYLEGKTSFIPNLPRPNVIRLQRHAYVSVIDCIADILAHGLDLDTINTGSACRDNDTAAVSHQFPAFQKNSESQHCREIYDRAQATISTNNEHHPLICLWINEWSDGFEPSYSVKANRGSAWLKTITISPPPNKVHSLEYTYPIAVGRSTSTHEEVERLFADELTKLANNTEGRLFYHGASKKNVRVHAELNVSLMDQPERRGSNYIMLGGGTYTSRWRHSANLSHISSNLQACDDCLANVLMANQPYHAAESEGMRSCQRCTCWRTQGGGSILEYPIPESYPPDMAPPSGTLRPVVLTYERLRFAAQMAHEKVFNGSWTMKAAKVFLRVEGMNLEAVNGITECSNNCRKVARSPPGSPAFVKLMELKVMSPFDYAPWKIPALWARAGVTLDQHVDVPMHLLFLGITKTVVLMVQEWTLGRSKKAAFLRYANAAMSLPVRLGLDWCKVIPFGGGKMGGYVAENYLAVARLSSWFFSPIKLIAPSPTEVGGNVDNVVHVIWALQAMISRLMSRTIDDEIIRDCKRHIHIFLSYFSKFDTDLRGEHKRTWVRSYNFMSLLNLPSVLKKYGPLRNLWEGGGQGERVLSVVKPTWGGYRKNWMSNMLDRMLRQMAIERIKSQQQYGNLMIDDVSPRIEDEHEYAIDENNTSDDIDDVLLGGTEESARGRNYVSYKSVEHVRRDHERRLPLSVLRLRTGEFVCVVQNTTIMQILPAIQGDIAAGVDEHDSCSNFFCWTLSEGSLRMVSSIKAEISNFCILLPKLDHFGTPDREQIHVQYTVIDSEWNVLHHKNSRWIMCAPRFPGARYKESGN
jgi:hypothetical protein